MKPQKLDIGIAWNNQVYDIWHYKEVPPGMRPAELQDLVWRRQVLYQVQIGPDRGDYYTDIVRPTTINILREMVRTGHPLYVKE